MDNRRTFPIDATKFDAELKKRGIRSRNVISEQMGYSRNYFNARVNDKALPANVMIALEAKYGIKAEDIAPVKEQKTIKAPDEVQQIELIMSDETIAKLEAAMLRAFTTALKGEA